MAIRSIAITPDPPQRDHDLTVTVTTNVSRTIKVGVPQLSLQLYSRQSRQNLCDAGGCMGRYHSEARSHQNHLAELRLL